MKNKKSPVTKYPFLLGLGLIIITQIIWVVNYNYDNWEVMVINDYTKGDIQVVMVMFFTWIGLAQIIVVGCKDIFPELKYRVLCAIFSLVPVFFLYMFIGLALTGI